MGRRSVSSAQCILFPERRHASDAADLVSDRKLTSPHQHTQPESASKFIIILFEPFI